MTELADSEVPVIKLTGDLNFSSPITMPRDVEINLNGHNITANISNALFTADNTNLTLTGDGEIQNKKWIAQAVNGGTVTIEGGTYKSQNEAFFANSGGKLVFNDGHIICNECALNAGGNATVEMNGGLIETADNMGIATNGSNGRGGNTITMNGGKIDANIKSAGYEAIGIYIANNDVFVMNDGEVIANGGTGLCMRAGDVTINGGSITATETDKNDNIVPDGKIADKDTVMMDCSAIIYHESANYPGKAGMKLTINGGTITGVDHSVEILSNEAEPQVFVNGGTFAPAYVPPISEESEPEGT